MLKEGYGLTLRLPAKGDIAEEIARTLVASIGLILAIPLTALIGVLVISRTPAPDRDCP